MKVYREWMEPRNEINEVDDETWFKTNTKPKYKIGEIREIYYGYYEGSNGRIKDIRYYKGDSIHVKPCYQYLINVSMYDLWVSENALW